LISPGIPRDNMFYFQEEFNKMKQELEAEYLATFKVGKNTSFYNLKRTKYQNV
jgi:hypothetical protein